MTFTEDWYSDKGCELLAAFARQTEHLDGRVVEVGCWEGKSTCALANAVFPAEVHAVDTWKGSPGEISEELARERDVFGQFFKNVDELTAGNVRPYCMDWRKYVSDYGGPIRFLHLDALHTYDEVTEQITAFLPLVVPGGWIVGDDIHDEGVKRAVLEHFPYASKDGHVWFWKVPMSVLEFDYWKAARTRSDINEHLPVFVRLCRELEATKVIELGTRGGVSTLGWLYGLEHQGHLWSVDIDPAPYERDGWTFIQGDDLSAEVFSQLPDSADIVFIDTSHAYDQTLAELNLYQHKVRPGGRIVLHDTELRSPYGLRRQPPFPVKKAVEEFCEAEGFEWENLQNNNGLGIVSIP